MDQVLTVTDEGAVRVLTLNRPGQRNALDRELLRALGETVAEAEREPGVHVVVLTGTPPAFCAGLDLRAITRPDWDPEDWDRVYRAFQSLTTPTIAAVNGAASTAGLGLVLGCDFAVAAATASFADMHARVGLLSASGMSAALADRIGLARAKEMWLTARPIDASRAYQWGIVNDVVPAGDLEASVRARAHLIADRDPDYVGTLLATHNAGRQATLQSHIALERRAAAEWLSARA
jgi:enoyl-CoA hydratase